jgi:hypothetical protein
MATPIIAPIIILFFVKSWFSPLLVVLCWFIITQEFIPSKRSFILKILAPRNFIRGPNGTFLIPTWTYSIFWLSILLKLVIVLIHSVVFILVSRSLRFFILKFALFFLFLIGFLFFLYIFQGSFCFFQWFMIVERWKILLLLVFRIFLLELLFSIVEGRFFLAKEILTKGILIYFLNFFCRENFILYDFSIIPQNFFFWVTEYFFSW